MKNLPLSEETIFAHAAKLPPPERAGYLEEACGSDFQLRDTVRNLLAAHDAAGSFLTPAKASEAQTIAAPVVNEERPGVEIGHYKLLEKLGEGGFGEVFVAEQRQPIRRRVALKIIKLGMDTRQVVARFEVERQALAMMDHPNIAKVLDAGASASGRPYFVMELVRGQPITQYCDENQLSTEDRLKLFASVCQAIQHAHQKGIIHRDIKPSNILVTLHDGVPVPKVIDFGIAKATQGELTDKTIYTQFQQFIGTPAYISPEQAEMSGLDIDTRADIYSLGVLLYELLVGKTPFDGRELLLSGLDAMRRTIREQEPLRPSTRLNTLSGDERTTAARRRASDPIKLSAILKGDIDWIVMKCLEKDRTRRYETANGLAVDVHRFLSQEPIEARPPSATYRFQKFIRRHRAAAVTTCTIAISLLAALVLTTRAYIAERKARLHAAVAEQSKLAANRKTEIETVRADTVTKFVTGFFDAVLPYLDARGDHGSIRQVLTVADHLAAELTNTPLAEAELRLRIAESYSINLHEYGSSEPQYHRVEHLGSALGAKGQALALRALGNRTAVEMWKNWDTNAHARLINLRGVALAQNPPDAWLASAAFGEAASFSFSSDQESVAEELVEEVLRTVPNDLLRFPYRMAALELSVRIAASRGDGVKAEQAADQLLAMLRPLKPFGDMERQQALFIFMATLRDGAPFFLPETSLRKAYERTALTNDTLRSYLQTLLGVAVARGGNWGEGLRLAAPLVSQPTGDVQMWNAAAHLAAMQGEMELFRTLCVSGLAAFASGANTENSRLLVEPLVVYPPDPAFLPVIRDLIARTAEGPLWTRIWGQLPKALMEYHSQSYEQALQTVEKYLREGPATLTYHGCGPYWASGWFLCSAINSRLERMEAARDAYQKGIKLHSTALERAGHPYTGHSWNEACAAELIRRQAAKLLAK